MKPLFKRAAIIGTGLIGGSLALSLKARRLAGEIIGVSGHEETIRWALRQRVIDQGSIDCAIIRDADLVIFATPPAKTILLADKVARIINQQCVVTDVCSTKKKIVEVLEKKFPLYVGSHPLAGSEKRGIAYAREGLFEGAVCIMTPTRMTAPIAEAKIRQLWKAFGSRVLKLTPEAHDRNLAFSSHLPHAVAYALMSAIPAESLNFSGGGLKDTTRIAASDGKLWADIFMSNKVEILKAIGVFEREFRAIHSALKRGDSRALAKILQAAERKRKVLV